MVVGLLVFSIMPLAVAAKEDKPSSWLDTTQIDSGIIGVNNDSPETIKTKLQIKKDKITYTYDLHPKTKDYFVLQSGNGTYNISVLQHVTDNKYKLIHTNSINVKLDDETAPFLGSIQNINWKDAELTLEKTKELTKNVKTDEEKINAIYKYIVETIKYDQELTQVATNDYIPNLDQTIEKGKGICYDYASLFAAMARSVDVPTKLVMGTSTYVKEYHAWNEVYINGSWIIIDTTVDAGLAAKDPKTKAKEADKYTASKIY